MTTEVWIKANFNVVNDGMGDVISWGNGVYTPLPSFITMFDNVIQTAISVNGDVIQAIKDNDNGRGFTNLV